MSEADIRSVCLGCEPNRDPSVEVFHIYQCAAHTQDTSGSMDRLVQQDAYLSGGSEVEGETNKLWCDFFHRGKR